MTGLRALVPGSREWKAKKAAAAERARFREELDALAGVERHTPPPVDPADADEIPPKVRQAVFDRDGGRCTQCPSHHGLDPHHRQMQSQGGPHTLPNLILLCRRCHDEVHANPGWAYDCGLLVHSYADPARISVWRFTSMDEWVRYLQGYDGSLLRAAD